MPLIIILHKIHSFARDGIGNNADTDDDGDGLTDSIETNTGIWASASDTGTDPLKNDTDGDELLDGVETNTGTWVSASNTGTNPNLVDTNGDGYFDNEYVSDPAFEWWFPLLPTGQTACYNASQSIDCATVGGIPPVCGLEAPLAFCGQDTQYSEAMSGRFEIGGTDPQNTVLDTATGLTWQQDLSSSTYDWQGAMDYCANLIYAGHADWRLPTPHELRSLVDQGRFLPAIDPVVFPNTPSSSFWSSSARPNVSTYAFRVDFYYGSVIDNFKGDSFSVRCVRGGR